ncbi:MAG: ribosome biogenesis GTPase YlqF [Peptoniphilus harei]|nr:ribosome biogenesis GTPase YlqF [Peptoniphilus harei]MBS6719934.1 ribosome biogenesis GTPase YlqF [Peptoniphilus harei]MDU1022354.1 ribosome biogenesis GTPase YlqF [Peptoniphilus harei]MDU3009939.1 ribosome biogenesis GTPase YlqF [Peptoniphilus harei]MDU5467457.1 ribosome biogenesis GTPase YlqF [Peptoniphilus harei]
MNINWYPGHMKKTIEDIEKKLKLVDFVIEIIDSRIPFSSRNPLFDDLFKNKKRLLIFNKSDLSDPKLNEEWMEKITDENNFAISYNAMKPNVNLVVKKSEELMADEIKKYEDKGLNKGPLRAMIVGIPNSGKSTFINSISGTKSARTGNRPGVTKTNQWIKIHSKLHLLDTPGVLWPKFEEKVGLNLAFTGAIKDEIMDRETLALKLIGKLKKIAPAALEERYKLSNIQDKEAIEIMDEIGKNRGALMRGGLIDYEKVSGIILDEFRKGTLGRITLEEPNEFL